MMDASYRNFMLSRVAYWLTLAMLPSLAVVGICAVLFLKPAAPMVAEIPVILISGDGKSTVLWNGKDNTSNITAYIERAAGDITSALFSNARDRSMAAAKVQRASTNFVPKSSGERMFLSLGAETVEKAESQETTFKIASVDVAYDSQQNDWSAVVKGTQVITLDNGTQSGRNLIVEMLFRGSAGGERDETGKPVLIYNMRASHEK